MLDSFSSRSPFYTAQALLIRNSRKWHSPGFGRIHPASVLMKDEEAES